MLEVVTEAAIGFPKLMVVVLYQIREREILGLGVGGRELEVGSGIRHEDGRL